MSNEPTIRNADAEPPGGRFRGCEQFAETTLAIREVLAKSGLSDLEQGSLLYSLALEKSLAGLGVGTVKAGASA